MNGTNTIPDLSTGFTAAERALVAKKILDKCDALDGVADGLVQDTVACQKTFNFASDVPTCSGTRDGTCLTTAQKAVVADTFSGAKTSGGAGNAGGVNAEVPADWSATRTRPLCPSPTVAKYSGCGDKEAAANFTCQ